ncbi:MAG: cupin domain-containing protein [Chloroflexi bacterium]|nr:cupin domain-containing protein [Chloroflexota bacterium]
MARTIISGMDEIRKIDVQQVAGSLTQPFSMVDVARVDDVIISLYACDGILQWHKHIDIDELFWTCEGTLFLDTQFGEVRLQPGELVVVPRGVEHRSRSSGRAIVMLVRCGIVPERKNGRNRLYATDPGMKLPGLSLAEESSRVGRAFWFQGVASVDSAVVEVAWGEGTWPTRVPTECDQLLGVLKGTMVLRTSSMMVHLHPGQFAVVPSGIIYQLSTTRASVVTRLARKGTRV